MVTATRGHVKIKRTATENASKHDESHYCTELLNRTNLCSALVAEKTEKRSHARSMSERTGSGSVKLAVSFVLLLLKGTASLTLHSLLHQRSGRMKETTNSHCRTCSPWRRTCCHIHSRTSHTYYYSRRTVYTEPSVRWYLCTIFNRNMGRRQKWRNFF